MRRTSSATQTRFSAPRAGDDGRFRCAPPRPRLAAIQASRRGRPHQLPYCAHGLPSIAAKAARCSARCAYRAETAATTTHKPNTRLSADQATDAVERLSRCWPGRSGTTLPQSREQHQIDVCEYGRHEQTKSQHDVPAHRGLAQADLCQQGCTSRDDDDHCDSCEVQETGERGHPQGQSLGWVENFRGGRPEAEVGEEHAADPGNRSEQMKSNQQLVQHRA